MLHFFEKNIFKLANGECSVHTKFHVFIIIFSLNREAGKDKQTHSYTTKYRNSYHLRASRGFDKNPSRLSYANYMVVLLLIKNEGYRKHLESVIKEEKVF